MRPLRGAVVFIFLCHCTAARSKVETPKHRFAEVVPFAPGFVVEVVPFAPGFVVGKHVTCLLMVVSLKPKKHFITAKTCFLHPFERQPRFSRSTPGSTKPGVPCASSWPSMFSRDS